MEHIQTILRPSGAHQSAIFLKPKVENFIEEEELWSLYGTFRTRINCGSVLYAQFC